MTKEQPAVGRPGVYYTRSHINQYINTIACWWGRQQQGLNQGYGNACVCLCVCVCVLLCRERTHLSTAEIWCFILGLRYNTLLWNNNNDLYLMVLLIWYCKLRLFLLFYFPAVCRLSFTIRVPLTLSACCGVTACVWSGLNSVDFTTYNVNASFLWVFFSDFSSR